MRVGDEGPHPTVKAVERRVEVEPETETIHFQKHLSQKQPEENKLCIVWRLKRGGGGEKSESRIW